MKKKEAMEIAPIKSNFLMEAIDQFLSVDHANSMIQIAWFKGEKEDMCSLEIYGPNGIEDHLNSGITLQQSDCLNCQILQDVLDKYLDSSTIQVSDFADVHVSFPTPTARNFHGITITNTQNQSKVSLDFSARGNSFSEIVDSYQDRIAEYRKMITSSSNKKK